MVLVKHSQGMEAVVARRPLSGKPWARQMGHEEMLISFRHKTRDGNDMEMRDLYLGTPDSKFTIDSIIVIIL